ncbi:MAG TPA: aminotransferase class V-fold PLP-dependent enzyme [Thermomicrobiaceae bacterium]|nr:aminotransferase class V-fold PLP-dependent enzyme [Thermomicrobiaceae bacterium]
MTTAADTQTILIDLDAAYADLLARFPGYASTQLDELRASDYARLDRLGQTYLDYTGGSLYAESQLQRHLDLLRDNVFGNPHSENPTSLAMTRLVEQTRAAVLAYFRASPDEYQVIFTPNATGALKLLGESYPFAPGGHYLLTYDNHNSVNGIREFARGRGAQVTYIPVVPPDLRVNLDTMTKAFAPPHIDGHNLVNTLHEALARAHHGAHNLFAFPAQSNFSGVQHPLEWIATAQDAGWDVLLDAAAFVPTNRLDLSRWHPDFVDISFYKIFGYPTGIGCLLGRKEAMKKLRRPWYAGGTITFSSVEAADDAGHGYYFTPGPAGFEDGTVNYLGIPAVAQGLSFIESIGIETIHNRVMALTGWLIEQIPALRHGNGAPQVQIHGPLTTEMRGGTLALNFHDPDGHLIESRIIEHLANRERISLRAGCHCNPGAREVALGFNEQELAACFIDKDRMTFEQFLHAIDGKTTGTTRLSLGLAANFADAHRFLTFAHSLRDVPVDAL